MRRWMLAANSGLQEGSWACSNQRSPNSPEFAQPRLSRVKRAAVMKVVISPSFRPTQTGLCKFGCVVWSSLIKWGYQKWGLKVCLPPFLEIGLLTPFRPCPAFFALFRRDPDLVPGGGGGGGFEKSQVLHGHVAASGDMRALLVCSHFWQSSMCKIYQCSTEGQRLHQHLAPVLFDNFWQFSCIF